MANQNSNGLPTSFWVISIVSLLWNLMGAMAYVRQAYRMDPLDPAQQALLDSTPAWATGAFAIAVFAGVLGCVALLMRKQFAVPLFMASLAGVVIQQINNFFLSDAISVYGAQAIVFPIIVLAIAVYLIYYSRSATAKGWLT